MYDSTLCVMFL